MFYFFTKHWSLYLNFHFESYSEFEHSWNMLRENSSHNIIEREQVESNPLNSFLYLIESGLYPPPELLIVIASCFRAHMISGGKTNLSEDFFGKDKQFDHCMNVSKITKYMDFELTHPEQANTLRLSLAQLSQT